MGLSTNTTPYTGGVQTFPVSFALDFLERSHVKVYVAGELDGANEQVYRAFTWNSDSEILVTDPLTIGDNVVVERTVSKVNLEVDFTAPGTATRQNLSRSVRHSFHAIHEFMDGRLSQSGEFIASLTPGIVNGDVIMLGPNNTFIPGPSVTEIQQAEASADAAAANADAAAASAAAAQGFLNEFHEAQFDTIADMLAYSGSLPAGLITSVSGHLYKVAANGELMGVGNNFYDLNTRTGAAMQHLRDALPEGTKFSVGGRMYAIKAAATGVASITYDLGVDGIVHYGELTSVHAGCVSDMVDTGSAFTGTDNFTALQNAVNYMNANGVVGLTVPADEKYLLKKDNLVDTGDGWIGIVIPLGMDFHLTMMAGATMAFEEDGAVTYNGVGGWFGHQEALNVGNRRNYPYGGQGYLAISGGTFIGSWEHTPNSDGSNKQGLRLISTIGNEGVSIMHGTFLNWRSQLTLLANTNHIRAQFNKFDQVAASCIRGTNAENYYVCDNLFLNVDDDPVSNSNTRLNVGDGVTTNAGNVRKNMTVSRNLFYKTESPLLVGALVVEFSSNTLILCHGGCSIGANKGDEGYIAPHLVNVSNNRIMASFERRDGVIEPPALKASNAASAYLSVYGTEPVKGGVGVSGGVGRPTVGDYDPATGKFIAPYGRHASGSKPGGYTFTEGDPTTAMDIGPGRNYVIHGNQLSRSVDPEAITLMSELGFGDMFTSEDIIDPPVSNASMRPRGLALHGYMQDVAVTHNIFNDMIEENVLMVVRDGTAAEKSKQFKNIEFSHNKFKGGSLGIGTDAPSNSADWAWGVTIVHNDFNIDYLHTHTDRTVIAGTPQSLDGSWQVPAGSLLSNSVCYGIQLRGVLGVRVMFNTFQNVYSPWLMRGKHIPGNVNQFEMTQSGDFYRNTMIGDFLNHSYDIGNKGIAEPLFASEAVIHTFEVSDPSASNYGEVINSCPTEMYDYPVDGKYMRGHRMRLNKTTTDVKELIRLTTGSNHVIGVDWREVFYTVSGTFTAATLPTASYVGQVIYVSDGDTGAPCAAIWDGTNWKVVAIGLSI